MSKAVSTSQDPIREVLTFAQDGTAPPLAWVVTRSRGGQIDPVSAAWIDSVEPAHMADLLEHLRPSALHGVMLALIELGHATLMRAIREGRKGATLTKAIGRYRAALDQLPDVTRGEIRVYWLVQLMTETIGWLFDGDGKSLQSRQRVADEIRAQIPPLMMSELLARIERGPA